MFGIGLPEMILIMALALIVVGPDKLPDLARSIAKGIMELKKTAEGLKDSLAENGNPLDDIKPDLEDAANNLKKDLLDLPPYERDNASSGSEQTFQKTAQNAADAYQELIKHTGVNNTLTEADAESKNAPESSEENLQTIEQQANIEVNQDSPDAPPAADTEKK